MSESTIASQVSFFRGPSALARDGAALAMLLLNQGLSFETVMRQAFEHLGPVPDERERHVASRADRWSLSGRDRGADSPRSEGPAESPQDVEPARREDAPREFGEAADVPASDAPAPDPAREASGLPADFGLQRRMVADGHARSGPTPAEWPEGLALERRGGAWGQDAGSAAARIAEGARGGALGLGGSASPTVPAAGPTTASSAEPLLQPAAAGPVAPGAGASALRASGVDVTLTRSADVLMSQPSASLVPAAAVAHDVRSQRSVPASGASQAQATAAAASSLAAAAEPGNASAQVTAPAAAALTELATPRTPPADARSVDLAVKPQAASAGTDGALAAASHRSQPRAAAGSRDAAQPPAFQRASVFEQIRVHIARAAADGSDHIGIRLRPATLGRLEIQLELGEGGRVQATVTAESRATYDLLRGDVRGLERALQDAGLKPDSGGLSFNLRGDGGATPDGGHPRAGAPSVAIGETEADGDTSAALPAAMTSPAVGDGRIDIHA